MRLFLTSALALTLCACGESSPEEPVAGNAAMDDAGGETVETAAVAGTAGERGIDCAAVKARSTQGPDILGVTLTMSGDEAFDKLACAAPEMVVETLTAVDGSRSFKGTNGVEEIGVFLAGPLGDDRVIKVDRSSTPPEGQAPAISGLMDQLTKKYGAFVETQNNTLMSYKHVKTIDGRSIGVNDPLLDTCLSGDGPNCGLKVSVNVYRAAENPGLARSFQVFLNDTAYEKKQWEAFKASVLQAAEKRQAQEIQQAAGKETAL
jgi:hypothetical protein